MCCIFLVLLLLHFFNVHFLWFECKQGPQDECFSLWEASGVPFHSVIKFSSDLCLVIMMKPAHINLKNTKPECFTSQSRNASISLLTAKVLFKCLNAFTFAPSATPTYSLVTTNPLRHFSWSLHLFSPWRVMSHWTLKPNWNAFCLVWNIWLQWVAWMV